MDWDRDFYEREAAVVLLALTAFEARARSIGIPPAIAARARQAVRRGLGSGADEIDPARMTRHLEECLGSAEAGALIASIVVLLRNDYWEWYIPLLFMARGHDLPPSLQSDPALVARIRAVVRKLPLSEVQYSVEVPLADAADRVAAAWFEFGPGDSFVAALQNYRVRNVLRTVRAEFTPHEVAAFEAWMNAVSRRRRPRWPAAFVVPDAL